MKSTRRSTRSPRSGELAPRRSRCSVLTWGVSPSRGICILASRSLGSGKMVEMGVARRGSRRSHRRARHPAHHAYLPHRRNRIPSPSDLEAKNAGAVRFINLVTVRSKDGGLSRGGYRRPSCSSMKQGPRRSVTPSSTAPSSRARRRCQGSPGRSSRRWIYTFSLLTGDLGTVEFKDSEGVTLNEEVDEVTGSTVSSLPTSR